ncbi:MAG: L-rhamnose mutarotase [Candidatus Nanopelagicaceae bacterium]
MAVKRIAQVVGVKPKDIVEYELIHEKVWPSVLEMLKKANVQNFSIYRYEHLLFSYMEYIGDDYEADMAKIAADPETQRWWEITGPMQNPVAEVKDGQWWHTIPEKFHLD